MDLKKVVFSFAGIVATTSMTHAADQVNLEADNLAYDEKTKTVKAEGKAEVQYQNRKLKAEKIIYNQNLSKIDLKGNIDLEDEHGNRYYAKSATFNDKLTKGEVNDLSGKMGDGSIFAATKGTRHNKDVMSLNNMIYTPCKICDNFSKMSPLWSITAKEVEMDNIGERISYKDATFDLWGTPVLYTPYFSHATPNAKRKSGFLTGAYRSLNTLGVSVSTPYYFNLAPNYDFTLTPTLTSQEGIILGGDFRHKIASGNYEISATITNPQERDEFGDRTAGHELRGHIEGTGQFDLSSNWSWGFNAKRSSDDTYLSRYKYGNEDLLTSVIHTEYMEGRNYAGMEAVSFQGLNVNDNPDTTPLVLPFINSHYEQQTGFYNSRFTLDGNVLALHRDDGVNSRRISTKGGVHLPHITNGGHVVELSSSVRADGYQVSDVITSTGTKDGTVGRVIPQAQASWRYPLANKWYQNRMIVEPVVDVIVSPQGGNPDKIPNEDSQEFELSDANLFSDNHFSGYDRVEGGPRSNYGVRGSINNNLGHINFLLGQSYRAKVDSNFTAQSGLSDNFSDYVGRISAGDGKYAELSYRFRTDKDDYTLRRNEVNALVNFRPAKFYVGYTEQDEDDDQFDQQEIFGNARVKLSEYWSITANGRRDMSEGSRTLSNGTVEERGGWINAGTGFVYEDECLTLTSSVQRDFTRDRDIEPSTSYIVKIGFKNLGSF